MYRADLCRLHERHTCATCGQPIEVETWAYVDGPRLWHRSCRPPIWLSDEELELTSEP